MKTYKGEVIQPTNLWNAVEKVGGAIFVDRHRKWQRVRELMGLEHSTSSGATLKKAYNGYFELPGGSFLALVNGLD